MTVADHPTTALLAANLRYWPTVAPLTGRELRRWARRAEAIPDGALKALALDKLAGEHFNAQVAATLATLAPLRHRSAVTEAIVAYQVMYDYLDGLTEQPVPEHLRSNLCLYRAFTDALEDSGPPAVDYFARHPSPGDGGYLQDLARAVRDSLAHLPATAAVRPTAKASAQRCAQSQARVHAAGLADPPSLAAWAQAQAQSFPLSWREWLAGAVSCVLGVHALFAAAADRDCTPELALALDQAYLPVAALSTMLDGVVDWRSDRAGGETPWLLSLYERHSDLPQPLVDTAAYAATQARRLPRAAHHLMTMNGVIAYYASAPAAAEPHARPAVEALRRELGATLAQAITVMRAWRACKRVSTSRLLTARRGAGHTKPGPGRTEPRAGRT
jgi:hypothetical protein